VHDGPGFYTSRILSPYANEAAWLLSEGADIAQIDEAMLDWGFPVGPLALLDEVGIDVGAKVARVMYDAFGERMKPPTAMENLLTDGRKGRKNLRGFYKYEKGKKAGVDESIYGVLGQSPSRRQMDRKEIAERLGMQMLNEAALCLQEGILRSPRDGDIGAVFGLGYPPFRGGPFTTVDQWGARHVVDTLKRLAEKHGERFAPAQLLIDAATKGTP
jgi:3-hydroxyacyl-CoA dehydrogenase/enoyl-CoA hydratase/3-hydroxybutyryl-CoA epimerase